MKSIDPWSLPCFAIKEKRIFFGLKSHKASFFFFVFFLCKLLYIKDCCPDCQKMHLKYSKHVHMNNSGLQTKNELWQIAAIGSFEQCAISKKILRERVNCMFL